MMSWAPKPNVAPMMVALASRGVRSTPSMPRMIATAITNTKKRHRLAASADMVDIRAPVRWDPERAAA